MQVHSISRISVIIPAYRAEKTIERALDSVIAQTWPAFEIIVVDDGSPDGQNEVVAQYGQRVRLVSQANGNAARARNAGLDQAQGDFIAFLDADDYWEPEKLARQVAVFEQYPEVVVVGSAYFTQSPGDVRKEAGVRKPSWCDCELRLRGQHIFRLATMMWTGTVIVRKRAIGEQRFVAGLEPAEDRDFWVRLLQRGPAYLISKPLATAVLEPDSLSRGDIERDCTKMLEVIDRHAQVLGIWGRLIWRSYTYYRWAAGEPNSLRALGYLLRSFAAWPMPYVGIQKMRALGRIKRLVVLLQRIILSRLRLDRKMVT